MKTIAIIPAYNEESTIADVIKATSHFVDEILINSDGSTSDVAKNAGATVIDNIVNRCPGNTIKRGYAEVIMQIDADG
jgi:glycosyltransferase involved in cell wall biosynthesis